MFLIDVKNFEYLVRKIVSEEIEILSKKINKPIGNISYSGAAINKLVSSFFGLINKYDYVPKTVICNFANFERFYFVTPSGESMQDWYINYSPKVTKASAHGIMKKYYHTNGYIIKI